MHLLKSRCNFWYRSRRRRRSVNAAALQPPLLKISGESE
jgi:hypothetical protein